MFGWLFGKRPGDELVRNTRNNFDYVQRANNSLGSLTDDLPVNARDIIGIRKFNTSFLAKNDGITEFDRQGDGTIADEFTEAFDGPDDYFVRTGQVKAQEQFNIVNRPDAKRRLDGLVDPLGMEELRHYSERLNEFARTTNKELAPGGSASNLSKVESTNLYFESFRAANTASFVRKYGAYTEEIYNQFAQSETLLDDVFIRDAFESQIDDLLGKGSLGSGVMTLAEMELAENRNPNTRMLRALREGDRARRLGVGRASGVTNLSLADMFGMIRAGDATDPIVGIAVSQFQMQSDQTSLVLAAAQKYGGDRGMFVQMQASFDPAWSNVTGPNVINMALNRIKGVGTAMPSTVRNATLLSNVTSLYDNGDLYRNIRTGGYANRLTWSSRIDNPLADQDVSDYMLAGSAAAAGTAYGRAAYLYAHEKLMFTLMRRNGEDVVRQFAISSQNSTFSALGSMQNPFMPGNQFNMGVVIDTVEDTDLFYNKRLEATVGGGYYSYATEYSRRGNLSLTDLSGSYQRMTGGVKPNQRPAELREQYSSNLINQSTALYNLAFGPSEGMSVENFVRSRSARAMTPNIVVNDDFISSVVGALEDMKRNTSMRGVLSLNAFDLGTEADVQGIRAEVKRLSGQRLNRNGRRRLDNLKLFLELRGDETTGDRGLLREAISSGRLMVTLGAKHSEKDLSNLRSFLGEDADKIVLVSGQQHTKGLIAATVLPDGTIADSLFLGGSHNWTTMEMIGSPMPDGTIAQVSNVSFAASSETNLGFMQSRMGARAREVTLAGKAGYETVVRDGPVQDMLEGTPLVMQGIALQESQYGLGIRDHLMGKSIEEIQESKKLSSGPGETMARAIRGMTQLQQMSVREANRAKSALLDAVMDNRTLLTADDTSFKRFVTEEERARDAGMRRAVVEGQGIELEYTTSQIEGDVERSKLRVRGQMRREAMDRVIGQLASRYSSRFNWNIKDRISSALFTIQNEAFGKYINRDIVIATNMTGSQFVLEGEGKAATSIVIRINEGAKLKLGGRTYEGGESVRFSAEEAGIAIKILQQQQMEHILRKTLESDRIISRRGFIDQTEAIRLAKREFKEFNKALFDSFQTINNNQRIQPIQPQLTFEVAPGGVNGEGYIRGARDVGPYNPSHTEGGLFDLEGNVIPGRGITLVQQGNRTSSGVTSFYDSDGEYQRIKNYQGAPKSFTTEDVRNMVGFGGRVNLSESFKRGYMERRAREIGYEQGQIMSKEDKKALEDELTVLEAHFMTVGLKGGGAKLMTLSQRLQTRSKRVAFMGTFALGKGKALHMNLPHALTNDEAVRQGERLNSTMGFTYITFDPASQNDTKYFNPYVTDAMGQDMLLGSQTSRMMVIKDDRGVSVPKVMFERVPIDRGDMSKGFHDLMTSLEMTKLEIEDLNEVREARRIVKQVDAKDHLKADARKKIADAYFARGIILPDLGDVIENFVTTEKGGYDIRKANPIKRQNELGIVYSAARDESGSHNTLEVQILSLVNYQQGQRTISDIKGPQNIIRDSGTGEGLFGKANVNLQRIGAETSYATSRAWVEAAFVQKALVTYGNEIFAMDDGVSISKDYEFISEKIRNLYGEDAVQQIKDTSFNNAIREITGLRGIKTSEFTLLHGAEMMARSTSLSDDIRKKLTTGSGENEAVNRRIDRVLDLFQTQLIDNQIDKANKSLNTQIDLAIQTAAGRSPFYTGNATEQDINAVRVQYETGFKDLVNNIIDPGALTYEEAKKAFTSATQEQRLDLQFRLFGNSQEAIAQRGTDVERIFLKGVVEAYENDFINELRDQQRNLRTVGFSDNMRREMTANWIADLVEDTQKRMRTGDGPTAAIDTGITKDKMAAKLVTALSMFEQIDASITDPEMRAVFADKYGDVEETFLTSLLGMEPGSERETVQSTVQKFLASTDAFAKIGFTLITAQDVDVSGSYPLGQKEDVFILTHYFTNTRAMSKAARNIAYREAKATQKAAIRNMILTQGRLIRDYDQGEPSRFDVMPFVYNSETRKVGAQITALQNRLTETSDLNEIEEIEKGLYILSQQFREGLDGAYKNSLVDDKTKSQLAIETQRLATEYETTGLDLDLKAQADVEMSPGRMLRKDDTASIKISSQTGQLRYADTWLAHFFDLELVGRQGTTSREEAYRKSVAGPRSADDFMSGLRVRGYDANRDTTFVMPDFETLINIPGAFVKNEPNPIIDQYIRISEIQQKIESTSIETTDGDNVRLTDLLWGSNAGQEFVVSQDTFDLLQTYRDRIEDFEQSYQDMLSRKTQQKFAEAGSKFAGGAAVVTMSRQLKMNEIVVGHGLERRIMSTMQQKQGMAEMFLLDSVMEEAQTERRQIISRGATKNELREINEVIRGLKEERKKYDGSDAGKALSEMRKSLKKKDLTIKDVVLGALRTGAPEGGVIPGLAQGLTMDEFNNITTNAFGYEFVTDAADTLAVLPTLMMPFQQGDYDGDMAAIFAAVNLSAMQDFKDRLTKERPDTSKERKNLTKNIRRVQRALRKGGLSKKQRAALHREEAQLLERQTRMTMEAKTRTDRITQFLDAKIATAIATKESATEDSILDVASRQLGYQVKTLGEAIIGQEYARDMMEYYEIAAKDIRANVNLDPNGKKRLQTFSEYLKELNGGDINQTVMDRFKNAYAEESTGKLFDMTFSNDILVETQEASELLDITKIFGTKMMGQMFDTTHNMFMYSAYGADEGVIDAAKFVAYRSQEIGRVSIKMRGGMNQDTIRSILRLRRPDTQRIEEMTADELKQAVEQEFKTVSGYDALLTVLGYGDYRDYINYLYKRGEFKEGAGPLSSGKAYSMMTGYAAAMSEQRVKEYNPIQMAGTMEELGYLSGADNDFNEHMSSTGVARREELKRIIKSYVGTTQAREQRRAVGVDRPMRAFNYDESMERNSMLNRRNALRGERIERGFSLIDALIQDAYSRRQGPLTEGDFRGQVFSTIATVLKGTEAELDRYAAGELAGEDTARALTQQIQRTLGAEVMNLYSDNIAADGRQYIEDDPFLGTMLGLKDILEASTSLTTANKVMSANSISTGGVTTYRARRGAESRDRLHTAFIENGIGSNVRADTLQTALTEAIERNNRKHLTLGEQLNTKDMSRLSAELEAKISNSVDEDDKVAKIKNAIQDGSFTNKLRYTKADRVDEVIDDLMGLKNVGSHLQTFEEAMVAEGMTELEARDVTREAISREMVESADQNVAVTIQQRIATFEEFLSKNIADEQVAGELRKDYIDSMKNISEGLGRMRDSFQMVQSVRRDEDYISNIAAVTGSLLENKSVVNATLTAMASGKAEINNVGSFVKALEKDSIKSLEEYKATLGPDDTFKKDDFLKYADEKVKTALFHRTVQDYLDNKVSRLPNVTDASGAMDALVALNHQVADDLVDATGQIKIDSAKARNADPLREQIASEKKRIMVDFRQHMGNTLELAMQADTNLSDMEGIANSPNISRALKNTATVGNIAMNAVIGTAITALFATRNMTLNDTVNEMAQAAISTAAYSALGKGMSMPAMFAQTLRNINETESFTEQQKDRQMTSAFVGMIASNSLGEMAADAVQRSFDARAMSSAMDNATRVRSQKATTLLGIAADTIVSSVISAGANLLLQAGQRATQSLGSRVGTGELESTYNANRQTSRALQQMMAESQAEYAQRRAYERAMQVNGDEFEVAVSNAQNNVIVYDSQGQITQVFDMNAGGRQGLDGYREKMLGSEFAYSNNENNYQATMIFQEATSGGQGYEYPISEAEYSAMGFDMQGNTVYEIDASYVS